jgi:AcrR family transcriptional regulator
MMTGESTVLRAVERSRLAAAVSGWSTADYVTVRALVALGDDTPERIGRFTAMGRQFVAEVRRRVRELGAQAVLAEPPSASERVLETATDQIVQPGPRELTMSTVADLAGVPRRTLYNMYAASGELVEACRRRGQTIWRARFEQLVLAAADDPQQRLFAVVDVLDAWVGSERFRRDQALSARPSFAPELREDDLRDHLAEIERFANGLAIAAQLRAPDEFGAFVTTLVAGAAAWFDRREAARASSVAVVERLVAPLR